jgi:hypothetical protein
MQERTVTESDRISIAYLMAEEGVPSCAISGLLACLEEGTRRGERDSMQALRSFRRKAQGITDPVVCVLQEISNAAGRLEDLDRRLGRHVGFLRSILADVPGSEFACRVRVKSIAAQAARLAEPARAVA